MRRWLSLEEENMTRLQFGGIGRCYLSGVVLASGPELSGRTSDLAAWLVGRSPGQGLALAGESAVPAAPTWV